MAFPFGSRTVGVLVRVIDQVYTDTHIGTLLLEAGAEPWAPQQWPNKQTRLQRLFAQMREDTGADVEPVALELVRLLLRKGSPSAERASPSVWWSEVLDAVAADGWEYDVDNERLVPTIPGVRVAEETTRIEAELNRRGWSTAPGDSVGCEGYCGWPRPSCATRRRGSCGRSTSGSDVQPPSVCGDLHDIIGPCPGGARAGTCSTQSRSSTETAPLLRRSTPDASPEAGTAPTAP